MRNVKSKLKKNSKKSLKKTLLEAFILIIWISLIALTTSYIFKLKSEGQSGGVLYLLYFADVLLTVRLMLAAKKIFVPLERQKGFFRRVIKSFFRPILKRLPQRKKGNDDYLKGESHTEFDFRFSLSGKFKSLLDGRVKANPKKCRTDREKIRMMYIRRVLTLAAQGKEVSPSKTPRELEMLLDRGEDPILFDTYEHIRYEPDYSPDRETAAACGIKK